MFSSVVVPRTQLDSIAETVIGHVIEPLVYGHSTGLSPVAVITAATFWTWLWGPIGLILATPLTLCLVVLGRHVDQLKFLEVMFGDKPPLTPPELIYQRMLARDPVEAAEQARVFLKEKPLAAYYDDILLEGLRLAQADAERGMLDDARMERIRDAVAEIVDDLSGHMDQVEPHESANGQEGRSRHWRNWKRLKARPMKRCCRNGGGAAKRFYAFPAPASLTKPRRRSSLNWLNDVASEPAPKRSTPCRCPASSVWKQRMSS